MTSYYLKGLATFMARVNEAPSVSFVNGGGCRGPGDPERRDRVPDFEQPAGRHGHRRLSSACAAPSTGRQSRGHRLWSSGIGAGGAPAGADQRATPSRTRRRRPSRRARRSSSASIPAAPMRAPSAWAASATWSSASGTTGSCSTWATRSGNAPADINPFNNYRGPILRNSVLWPPDNPEDTVINTDNFTLLRFSDYVKAVTVLHGQWRGSRREVTA